MSDITLSDAEKISLRASAWTALFILFITWRGISSGATASYYILTIPVLGFASWWLFYAAGWVGLISLSLVGASLLGGKHLNLDTPKRFETVLFEAALAVSTALSFALILIVLSFLAPLISTDEFRCSRYVC